jgi:hypothetical protein
MRTGISDQPPAATVPLRQASRRLGLPWGWVLRIREAARFPVRAVRVGAAWRVDRAELERYLREWRGPDHP